MARTGNIAKTAAGTSALVSLLGCSVEGPGSNSNTLRGTVAETGLAVDRAKLATSSADLPKSGRANEAPSGPSNRAGIESLERAAGTVLPKCNGAPVDAGPKLWRLTRTQWMKSVQALGGSVDVKDFPQDSKAGRFDNNPNGLILRSMHADYFATQAAKVAPAVAAGLRDKVACAKGDAAALGAAACRTELVRESVARVFRRPASTEEIARFSALGAKLTGIVGAEAAFVDLVSILLRSPHFLFRAYPSPTPGEDATLLKSFAAASHLSYSLVDTPPDDELLAAARSKAILTPDGLRAQAARLLRTTAGREKFIDFAEQWLLVKRDASAFPERDPKAFADYTTALYADMLKETETFLREDVYSGNASVKLAFSSTNGYVTPALDAYYGGNRGGVAPGGDAKKVDLASKGRFGLLTQGAVMLALSKPDRTAAIHRAATVRTHFLCYPMSGPPADALDQSKLTPAPPGPQTEKMKFEAFVSSARSDCAACHKSFMPYGLAIEEWGADGRHRTRDQGLSIDASGTVPAPDGSLARFSSGIDFLGQVSGWDATAHCTMLHAHEFHWGSMATKGHSCAIEKKGRAQTSATPLLDVYLAPVADADFFEAW